VAVFLFVPYSVPGHVHPMLPVIAELAGRGERVRVAVGDRFARAVRAAGAETIVLPTIPDVYVPERPGDRLSARWLGGRLRRLVRNRQSELLLDAQLRGPDRPDVLVVDPMLAWADRVARRHRVGTATLSTTFHPNAAAFAELARSDGGFAHPRWHRLRPLARRARLPGRLHLANTPAELQPALAALPPGVHLVGPLVRRRLTAPRPTGTANRVVYVSPGTVFARGVRFFDLVVQAFAGRPWTVFLATGHLDPAALGPMPENVLARRSHPQLRLLAGSDVFITHAGMNSVTEGLTAGVPMVFFPRSAEQRHLARRLTAARVGVWPDARLLSPEGLFELVEQLVVDPAARAASQAWQARFAAVSGAALAADLLQEQVALSPRRP